MLCWLKLNRLLFSTNIVLPIIQAPIHTPLPRLYKRVDKTVLQYSRYNCTLKIYTMTLILDGVGDSNNNFSMLKSIFPSSINI